MIINCSQVLAAAAATAAASGLGGAQGLPPQLPSSGGGASTASHGGRRRRKEEVAKQATIRQHYYPEGGWGYVVALVGFAAQLMTHGLQMSFGVLLLVLLHRWDSPQQTTTSTTSSLPFSHLQQMRAHLATGSTDEGGGEVATAAASRVAIRSYRWIEAGKRRRRDANIITTTKPLSFSLPRNLGNACPLLESRKRPERASTLGKNGCGKGGAGEKGHIKGARKDGCRMHE